MTPQPAFLSPQTEINRVGLAYLIFFVVPLHMRTLCIILIIRAFKENVFLGLCKKNVLFFISVNNLG